MERVYDTYKRSEGEGVVEEEEGEISSNLIAEPEEIVRPTYPVNEELDKYINTKLSYNPTSQENVSIGRTFNSKKDGEYATSVIDMSNGIDVTYQSRNARKDARTNVDNAVMVTDYLYDNDFTDGYAHEHAFYRINNLKNKIGKFGEKDQKFVTVRENTGDNTWKVRVIPTSELKESDFGTWEKLPVVVDPVSGKKHQDYLMKDNNVYSQGYAVLSDFDISEDGNKIKLYSGSGMFRNQGIPLLPNDSRHVLRLPGGVGNYGKYQDIDKLNLFGPYIGGTVTVISDDGSIVKKITGSVRDIVRTAQIIQKQTDGAEVHFLQSDAGSMNVKPMADKNNTLSKNRLGISRNNEPWAGASEILIKPTSNTKLAIRKKGGEMEIYKAYMKGEDESQNAINVYDKLNRKFYNEAKKVKMTPPNYIMTHLSKER